jgi:hypothetical protein
MPVRRTSRPVALVLALLLAGCTAPGADKFTSNSGAAASSTAAAAVQAFGHLCGRLEWAEVQRRAGAYGFVPVDPNRLPSGAAPADGTRMLGRPGAAPAVLIWSDAGPRCELGVSGVDTAALTGEFDAMLRAFEQRPEMAVNSVPPPAGETGAFRLQRMAVLTPRALVPMPPRAMALRTAVPGAPGFQAVMVMQVARPGGAPTLPPPGPGAPKD